MKNVYATRLVAAVAVVAFLLAFAMPAVAAAPAAGHGIDLSWSWSPTSIFQWVQSLWTGWFDMGDDSGQGSGMGNVYDQQDGAADPDGVAIKSFVPSPSDSPLSFDGTF